MRKLKKRKIKPAILNTKLIINSPILPPSAPIYLNQIIAYMLASGRKDIDRVRVNKSGKTAHYTKEIGLKTRLMDTVD